MSVCHDGVFPADGYLVCRGRSRKCFSVGCLRCDRAHEGVYVCLCLSANNSPQPTASWTHHERAGGCVGGVEGGGLEDRGGHSFAPLCSFRPGYKFFWRTSPAAATAPYSPPHTNLGFQPFSAIWRFLHIFSPPLCSPPHLTSPLILHSYHFFLPTPSPPPPPLSMLSAGQIQLEPQYQSEPQPSSCIMSCCAAWFPLLSPTLANEISCS